MLHPFDRLVLIGAGRMGRALLKGWCAQGLGSAISVFEPQADGELAAMAATHGLALNPADLPAAGLRVLVLVAVKPQVMAPVLAQYQSLATSGNLFLSIAAGKTLAGFRAALGPDVALIRAMPNTPAAVGRGITVCVADGEIPAAEQAAAERLLGVVGQVSFISDEGLMDAVTAVSGSGPAYVFLLVEALAAAAKAQGLDDALALQLARATVTGAGELLHQASESAATLRENVTSPGGTTAAALSVLMAPDGLGPLLARAVDAAAKRGRELGKGA